MQIPFEMRVYTKCSGHKTLEGLSKQQLGSRKTSENHRGHCGRRDLIFGLISHIGSYQYDNDVVWGFEASDCFDYAGQNAVIHKAQISNVLVVIDGRDMSENFSLQIWKTCLGSVPT